MKMDKVVEYLSKYSASLKFEELPAEVVHQAKRVILDTLGCAIGGFHSEPSKIARTLAADIISKRPASVLGSGNQTSMDLAAFANGVMMRYIDFNDAYWGKESGHPSDAIAAVLSPAEGVEANGKVVITATVLAYEVFCRFCDAVCIRARGFDHTTFGVIAGTLAASKAMGLSREQTAAALNLSLAANNTLYQTRIGQVSDWKGCAFANASRNAVFSVQLASLGLRGPDPIFSGSGGFFAAVSGGPFQLAPFGGPGRPFKILETNFKKYPLGSFAQTAVEAAIKVRQRVPAIESIKEVIIRTVQPAIDIMAGDPQKWHPTNRETADHSLPYAVSVALTYGAVELKHFEKEYWSNPELLDLVRKIKVSVSEEATRRAPEATLTNIEVLTTSGDRHSAEVAYHRGHFKNPMSDEELEEKFRALAHDLLSPSKVRTILDCLWGLEQMGDIGRLIRMVQI
jgi:2-methylcitrate dehydratase